MADLELRFDRRLFAVIARGNGQGERPVCMTVSRGQYLRWHGSRYILKPTWAVSVQVAPLTKSGKKLDEFSMVSIL